MSLITSKEGLRSSQVDLQSARKGLKSAVRASKPAERPRGRDRQTDGGTERKRKMTEKIALGSIGHRPLRGRRPKTMKG